MSHAVNDLALDTIFRKARTYNGWKDQPVSLAMLQAVYELMALGPTSANCSPARIVFVTSAEGKARLKPLLMAGNVDKTMKAPATAIIGHDLDFAKRLPELFPHNPTAKDWFANPEFASVTAFRNGSLQGAYFMMAARALGLDCGPMSGFDSQGVDREFFAGTNVKSNFLCNVGIGDAATIFPRSPRLAFDDACKVV